MPSDINPLSGTSLESILTGRVEDLHKRPHIADRAIQKLDPSDNRSDPEPEVRDRFSKLPSGGSAPTQLNLAEGPEGPGRNPSLEDDTGQGRRKGDLLNVFF